MTTEDQASKSFWAKHKKKIFIVLAIYAVSVLGLIALSWGPQEVAFRYQIF